MNIAIQTKKQIQLKNLYCYITYLMMSLSCTYCCKKTTNLLDFTGQGSSNQIVSGKCVTAENPY